MANSDGIITQPVRLYEDVCKVLGVSDARLSYVCGNSHGRINSFSKKKPVRLKTPFPRIASGGEWVDSYLYVDYQTEWWRSSNGYCGLDIPDTDILVSPTQDKTDPSYGYLPPQGGSESSYRLADFDGYNHYANKDLVSVYPPQKIIQNKGFRFTVQVNRPQEGELGLLDIFKTINENVKLIISMRSPSSATLYRVKELTMQYGSTVIDVPDSEASLGANVGSQVWFHIYASDHIGRLKSLKFTPDTSTVFSSTVVSSMPYDYFYRGEMIRSANNNYVYYLFNITFGITAAYGSGGTLAAGSYLKFFEFKSDDTDYNAWEIALWESGKMPALTVKAGEQAQLPLEHMYTVQVSREPFKTGVIIWYGSNGLELARMKKDIRIGDPAKIAQLND